MAFGIRGIFWLLLHTVAAITIDINDVASMKSAASVAAARLMGYYKGGEGNNMPGLLPPPYYWWECGAMFGVMLDYWKFTGDEQYNPKTYQALIFQRGENDDYEPRLQALSLGNDDQAFWAMAAMSAAEYNFPDSTVKGEPSWLALAQAVFNNQIARWDTKTCGGGIHWQIYTTNKGYYLKNTISNGMLFQLAARLYRYTGDQIYKEWAVKTYDWLKAVKLIDDNWSVYDNSDADNLNCTQWDRNQWTYNAATLLIGAATMWNVTEEPIWQNRTQGLLDTTAFAFFPNGIAKEICEQNDLCNVDQRSFKAYLAAWMARTTQMAPWTYNKIMPLLKSSAVAAAKQCSGGSDGNTCGTKWFMNETWDGTDGVGQEMSAMSVFLSTTIQGQVAPLTNQTGGTSVSNPTAGQIDPTDDIDELINKHATQRDRAGAWIITVLLVLMCIAGSLFLSMSSFEGGGAGPKIREKRMSAFGLPGEMLRRKKSPEKTEKVPEVLDLASKRNSIPLPRIEESEIPPPVPVHRHSVQVGTAT